MFFVMCGICGLSGRDDAQVLRLMAGTLTHRGPDEKGFHEAPGIGLGVRRLSIIDVPGGHQPSANEDGTVVVAFNGEIYNYRELRGRLESSGHRFTTGSDTEVLPHLYEEYGDAGVHLLQGMFAFALWDGKRRRLLLARDRLVPFQLVAPNVSKGGSQAGSSALGAPHVGGTSWNGTRHQAAVRLRRRAAGVPVYS